MIYLLDFRVDYAAQRSQEELLARWSEEAARALTAAKAGAILDRWRCVGQRRVLVIVELDRLDRLDLLLRDLPIMRECGDQLRVDLTPLRRLGDQAPGE